MKKPNNTTKIKQQFYFSNQRKLKKDRLGRYQHIKEISWKGNNGMDYDLKLMIEKVSKWSEVQTAAKMCGLVFGKNKIDTNDTDLLEVFSGENIATWVDNALKAIIDLKTGRHDRELLNPNWLERIGAEKLSDEQLAKLVFKETKIMLSKYREIKIELFEEFISSRTGGTGDEKRSSLDAENGFVFKD